MKLGLCVFNKRSVSGGSSPVNSSRWNELETGYLTDAEIPLATRQKWIDDIGKSAGLECVDLNLVPLSGVDLSPLSTNKSFRQLMLGKSGLANSQLSGLKGMDQLEELSLAGIGVDGRTIEWLGKTFPNLRRIPCEQGLIRRLRLENIPNLESLLEKPKNAAQTPFFPFLSDRHVGMDALRIVNAPKLQDHFVLYGPMILLHIDSAPALSGLVFHEPLPANSVVKRVQNLKFFAAGGPTCTDAIANEVLNCTGLQRLTLAYTDLSPATLQRIPEVSELEYLVLTGSKIDDQFVESLARLEKLTTLRLDQTPIRSASVSAISKLKNLEVLDIGGLQLTAENVSQLISSLSKLKHVTLVGAELTVDNMRQIAKLSSLQSLDLSNCELNDDLLNALAESPPAQLVELKLNSAKLGEAGFQNLVRKLRNTRFALKDTEVNPQTLDTLVMQGRATDIESIETPMRGGMNMNSIAMSENNSRIQRTTFGISVSRVLRSVEPLLERGELSVKEVEFLIKLAHGVSRPDLVEKLANYHVRHFSLSRFQQNDFARTLLGNARKEMRKK